MRTVRLRPRRGLLLACGLAVLWAAAQCRAAEPAHPTVKNAIVFIIDGCSSEQYTLARWYKGGKAAKDLAEAQPAPLAFDPFRVGAVRTFIADSAIADSAPTGTAYATGVRTSDKFISIGPKDESLMAGVPKAPGGRECRPLATLLEGAKRLGKATGIAVTCRLSHATPAAFVAHTPDRDAEEGIMEQLVHQGVDVALGGGREFLRPESMGGKRRDGQNLLNALRRAGYDVVRTSKELSEAKGSKLFGLFAESHLNAEVDQPTEGRKQPTLAEMVRKALEVLSTDPDGFFLMIEASQVDWANHANDPAHLLHELLAADDAAKEVITFAANNPDTLVLILSDHNTGGMSIGNYRSDKTYSQTDAKKLLEPLMKMKKSASHLWKKVADDRTPERVQAVVRDNWGIGVSAADAADILAIAARAKPGEEHYPFGEIICRRHTYVGWTSHGHAGGDVPLFAHVPEKVWADWLAAQEQPPTARSLGTVDGPRIGALLARSLGISEKLTDELFAPADEALPGHNVLVEEYLATRRLTVLVEPKDKDKKDGAVAAKLWVNTNRFELGDRPATRPLDGLVVYIPLTDTVYLPRNTLATLRAEAAQGR
ncbi:MAG: hypothetical protein FJ291_19530 [Planctomycetes bacterium]|nr:hypothetical protein [Planctomycetota bacterium]